MRLNWFSPLPPAQTAIADVTLQLLPALCEAAEVVLWTDQPGPVRVPKALAEVRHYHPEWPPWRELNRADLSVYHLGNNTPFHAGIWRVSRQQPGLVVLHDLHLQHLFVGYYLAAGQGDAYVSAMDRYYGANGAWAAREVLAGRLGLEWVTRQFPLTELALEGALGVVVHTPRCWRALRRLAECPVVQLPLPYAQRSPAGRSPGPPRPDRIDQAPYALVMFGHIYNNRGLEELFQVMGQVPVRDRFHLDVYGTVVERDRMAALIEQARLGGGVRLHGHVPERVLEAALAAADLAVNLRFPSMGEASHSQLRIWSHGLPSIVTRTGWYAGLPDEAVLKVRPGQEVAEVHAHLRAFLRDPAPIRRMGERGRQLLLARHDPRSYVAALVEYAGRLCGRRATWAGQGLTLRAGETLKLWVADPTAAGEKLAVITETVTRMVA
jgi:glycosyltransferase involved in cell wall biosynthesis